MEDAESTLANNNGQSRQVNNNPVKENQVLITFGPEPEPGEEPWGGSNEDGDGLEGQGEDPDAEPEF